MRGDGRRRRQKAENYWGELHIRNEKAAGSIPVGSTILLNGFFNRTNDFLAQTRTKLSRNCTCYYMTRGLSSDSFLDTVKKTHTAFLRWEGRVALAGALILLAGTDGAKAAQEVWTGASDNFWNNAANWSLSRVPGLDDVAIITNAATVTLTGSAAAGSLLLDTGASLELAGQTLTISNALTVGPGGMLTVDSGTLAGIAATLNGVIGWTGGSLAGTLLLSSNSILNILGGQDSFPECLFYNCGKVIWAGGTLQGGNGTQVINYGTWEMTSDQTWVNATGGDDEMDNYGVLLKSGGSSSSTLAGVAFYQLDGEVSVQAGLSLDLQGGGGLYGGSISAAPSGLVLLSSGQFNIDGAATASNTWIDGGSLIGDNVIIGGMTWAQGTWNTADSITIGSNAVLGIEGGTEVLDLSYCDVTNYGTVQWDSGALQGGVSGYIENDGIWIATSDQEINSADGTPRQLFLNNGTLAKTGGTADRGTSFQGVIFNQTAGVTVAQSGTAIIFAGGGSLTGGGIGTSLPTSLVPQPRGEILLSAGQFMLNGAITGTNVVENGAELAANNILYGGLTWTSGEWEATASVTIFAQSTLVIAGIVSIDCPMTNYGIVGWTSEVLQASSIVVNNGLWDVPDGAVLAGSGGLFENAGILRKVSGTNTTLIATGFQSRGGALEVDQGTLSLDGTAYVQGSGPLTLTISGTNAGEYGQVATSVAYLEGPLNVILAGGFTAAAGSQFKIISCSSLVGVFTSANLPAGLSIIYTNSGVILAAAINTGGPTLNWLTPSGIPYGTALGPEQLNAQASVPGSYSYSPEAGTLLGAGLHTLSVLFTPESGAFSPVFATVNLLVEPVPLTIIANNTIMGWGRPVPTLSASFEGFVGGDSPASLQGAPSLTTSANSSSPPGSYPIMAGAGTIKNVNYFYYFVAGTLAIQQLDFYVSSSGSDSNPGTLDQPFLTLGAAVRAEEAAGTNAHRNVFFRGGEYFNVCQFLQGPGTPGKDDSDVAFTSYPGESAVLYGGQPLTGWSSLGNGMWMAALPSYPGMDSNVNQLHDWEVRMLLVDGVMAGRAQFPTDGSSLTYLNTGGFNSLNFKPGDLPGTMVATNMEVMVDFSWDAETVGVSNVDAASQTVSFSGEGVRNDRGLDFTGVQTYRIYNTAEGMSRPGQFYFDRGGHKVIYWPLDGKDPNTSEIIVPTTDCMFYIFGYPGASPWNITFSNLTLKVNAVDIENEGDYGELWDYESLIHAFYCTNLTLANLTMGWCGGNALGMDYGFCTNALLVNSEIGFCGGYGAALRAAPCVISNNYIHDTGLISWQSPAVRVSRQGMVIQNNIFNSKMTAIGDHDMDLCVIALNYISNAMTVLRDMGAVYTYFGDGAIPYLDGNVIASNVIQNVNPPPAGDGSDPRDYFQPAVYFDEETSNSVVQGNVFLNCNIPFFCNTSTSNAVTGNVAVNTGCAYLRIYASPDSTPPNVMQGNVFVSNTNIVTDNPWVWNSWQGNLFWSTDASANSLANSSIPDGAAYANPQFTGPAFDYIPSSPAPWLGIAPLVWEPSDPGVNFVTAPPALQAQLDLEHGQEIVQLVCQPQVALEVQTSTNLRDWSTLLTLTPAASLVSLTNAFQQGAPTLFWRALNP